MGIRYIGGQPSRIDRHTRTKNMNRWMHVPKVKERINPFDPDFLLCAICIVATCVLLIWFVGQYFC